jgi:activator of 2-hydroxyglutaryl-CoA dehydratase
MITAGVDVGSASAKALFLKDDIITDWSITHTTGDSAESAQTVMRLLLDKTGLSQEMIDYIVSTGIENATILAWAVGEQFAIDKGGIIHERIGCV